VEAKALGNTKEIFGSARNVERCSLTVLANRLTETGSRMRIDFEESRAPQYGVAFDRACRETAISASTDALSDRVRSCVSPDEWNAC